MNVLTSSQRNCVTNNAVDDALHSPTTRSRADVTRTCPVGKVHEYREGKEFYSDSYRTFDFSENDNNILVGQEKCFRLACTHFEL